jgi:TRAP-type mannitol/chloroaromatic compound transport system substrate-binding protein
MALKRRQFLSGSAGVLVAGAVAAPAVAQSAPEIKWRMTSSFPRVLDNIFGTAQTFSKYIADATDNRFQLQVFSAGEIVPGLQALDAVSSGSVECCQTPLNFYLGKDPTLSFATALPFGPNARLQYSWWHFGGGAEIINGVLAGLNTISFASGNSGTQMGGFFRKEINQVEDLKGLKFRIAGLGGQVLARLGVIPQQIAGGDVYPALEKGTIDGAEFVSPYDDEKLGLHKIAKYYYYPGWWEGGAMLHFAVNLKQWEELPKSYQHIWRQACDASNNWMLGRYDVFNGAALRRLIGQGTQLRGFPIPVMEACFDAAQQLYGELAASNANFKKALDSMVPFRTQHYEWWQVGEYSYDSFMIRMRGKVG